MKPSDFSTSRTRARTVEAGVTTVSRRRSWALRIRVSISPIGSERAIFVLSLPARLHQARDLPQVAQLAQRDTAHLHLAVVGTRPARDLATIADATRRRVPRQGGELQLRREALLHRHALVL